MNNTKTTITINDDIKKASQIKAMQNNITLSFLINDLLNQYLNRDIEISVKRHKQTQTFKDIKKTNLKTPNMLIDRNFIYELK